MFCMRMLILESIWIAEWRWSDLTEPEKGATAAAVIFIALLFVARC